ncbi:MAG: alpha/beta hydrolase domain-containing protein [Bacteroidales bacterium]|nr:alpha/beta hydrolase domain-containing protein [Bacteroidales bacterium]
MSMNFFRRRCLHIILLSLSILVSVSLKAVVTRVVVTKTESYLENKKFGHAGSYLRLTGQFYGEVDPEDPLNSVIQDINLAPVNERGMVEYVSDFVILRPVDMEKSNGLLFLSLPNRGNIFPADSVLLSRGYIYLWCAWQGDVLRGGNRLTMRVPYASVNGDEVAGILRTEFQVNTETRTLDLSSGFFSGQTHHSYETVSIDNSGSRLTRRVLESDPREPVPNTEWAFSDCSKLRYPGVPNPGKISAANGFQPGYIYELIYMAKNPLVLGLGFAAVRDITSFLRNETEDELGYLNPLTDKGKDANPVKVAVMQGVSQCSNFTRTFLFLGFNQDEEGRQVFDGVNAHIGTRRISLNVRFGRPGGGGLQREDHLFPGNDPPFTWSTEYDSISGVTGGILGKCAETGTCPKIMQTLSSSEYWQLRASLTTTDSRGLRDLEIPENVRIYLFAGTQHTPSESADQASGFPMNPNSWQPYLRALLVRLEQWVMDDLEPPPAAYPTLATGTLVSPGISSTGWPAIPGIPYNGKVNELPLLDYGPEYDFRNVTGILRLEPPQPKTEEYYRTLVPKVDRDGNETGGIRGINIRVPLGTHTGWALRREGYGKGDLSSLNGMFIPFKKTKKDRKETSDPRKSLQERYKTHERYVEEVRKAAGELVIEGFLLPDDARTEIEKAEKSSVLK